MSILINTRNHKTLAPKPVAEHAIMEFPPIVTEAVFKTVQDLLRSRSPK